MESKYIINTNPEGNSVNIIKFVMITLATALLVLLGTHYWIFTCIAFLVASGAIVLFDQIALPYILFLVPLASIFKISPESMSLLTLLQIVYVGYFFFKRKEYDAQMIKILSLMIYVIIVSSFCGSVEILVYIKLFSKLMFLWVAFKEIKERTFNSKQETLCEYAYIVGTLTAIIFSYLNSSFFPIRTYIEQRVELFGSEEEAIVRFSGLAGDANYFAVGVIISMCLCVILLFRNEMHFITFFAFFSLLFFATAATGSKSAMIMIVWPVALFLLSNNMKRRYFLSIAVIICICFVAFYVFNGRITIFDNTIRRFRKGTNGVESLTTGRTTIWLAIIEYFFAYPASFFLGNGASTYVFYLHSIKKAAHNAYIDLVYQLGLVGTVLFINILYCIIKSNKRGRNILNYSIFVSISVMYMFLNQFSDYEWPFHIIIAALVLYSDLSVNKQTTYNDHISRKYKYLRI